MKMGIEHNSSRGERILRSKLGKSADPSLCHATIECRCGNSYVVTRNPKREHQITNWSRHFKTCGSERKPKQNSTQSTLNMFVKVNQSPCPNQSA